jgi:UDPglucose 6-dehydrogenase
LSYKILIVGHGFVGKAVDYGFSHPDVLKTIVDPVYGTDINDIDVLGYDCIFVCVPTPMGSDSNIDASIIDTVLRGLKGVPYHVPIIIKSTVTPDIIKKIASSQLNVVYNPEFLTEKSANEQFASPQFHILGGLTSTTRVVEGVYEKYSLCDPCPVLHMTAEEASLVKYTINSYLAMKVTFFNQLYDTISNTDANFSTVIKAVGMDKRIGPSHSKVPGFDGKAGFGGACFPKDTSAFVSYSECLTLLAECVKINNNYRSGYDRDTREKEQNIVYNG